MGNLINHEKSLFLFKYYNQEKKEALKWQTVEPALLTRVSTLSILCAEKRRAVRTTHPCVCSRWRRTRQCLSNRKPLNQVSPPGLHLMIPCCQQGTKYPSLTDGWAVSTQPTSTTTSSIPRLPPAGKTKHAQESESHGECKIKTEIKNSGDNAN